LKKTAVQAAKAIKAAAIEPTIYIKKFIAGILHINNCLHLLHNLPFNIRVNI
jgi:hypothetical protein